MTNDFVALLKDSSLVSVLTVVELTKQTQIFATNLAAGSIPGAFCAALYLAMSLPLAALARTLERRWRIGGYERSTIRDVELSRGGRELLSGINLDVRNGRLDRAARARRGPARRRCCARLPDWTHSTRGTIEVGDARLEGSTPPARDMLHRLRRNVGFVFQFHCLFEHMSALQNVCLAPVHVHGVPQPTPSADAVESCSSSSASIRAPTLAARAVGRGSAACRHCTRAGRESAGAADG